MDILKEVVKKFAVNGDYVMSEPYGTGHIHDTFAVTFNQGGRPIRYLFQKLNSNVFERPELLMNTIKRITDHQHSKIDKTLPNASRRALTLIHTADDKPFYCDVNGNYWRSYIFIEGATAFDIIEKPSQAFEAAKAFGEFQKQLIDLAGVRLPETIPDFHNTPKRFDALIEAIEKDEFNRALSVEKEIRFAMEYNSIASVLLDLNTKGVIPERITHNDTKLNNVLLDDSTGEGICVIDLDTVMPGLALYDFGDMIRSVTRSGSENEMDLSRVEMQMDIYEALLSGYLETAGDFLVPDEINNLAFSGKIISLETGVRFLTDYLSGDIYFKTSRERENVDRCNVQFKMVRSIEEQEEEMNLLCDKLIQEGK